MLQLWELTSIIAESHSRLPDWISLTCARLSEDVTTLVVEIWPIKNSRLVEVVDILIHDAIFGRKNAHQLKARVYGIKIFA